MVVPLIFAQLEAPRHHPQRVRRSERARPNQLGAGIGGPNVIQLPDGRFVAVVRLYDGRQRTSLCWLDPEQGTLTEAITLPCCGDTSYAGLVGHDGLLWIGYYSSHEEKTAVYPAKVKVTNN